MNEKTANGLYFRPRAYENEIILLMVATKSHVFNKYTLPATLEQMRWIGRIYLGDFLHNRGMLPLHVDLALTSLQ